MASIDSLATNYYNYYRTLLKERGGSISLNTPMKIYSRQLAGHGAAIK